MKKLVYDICEKELKDEEDIELALEDKETWAASARASGVEPRASYPARIIFVAAAK